MDSLLIITTTHSHHVLEANLEKSPLIQDDNADLIYVKDYGNVAKSYNSAHTQYHISHKKLLMFVHEDVFIPHGFTTQLKHAIDDLKGSNWGVLGVAGVRYGALSNGGFGRTIHGHINDRGRQWGNAISKPEPVQTLDELLLIVNPSLRFDEQFDLDFYGADICMQAHEKGLGVFVIPGYVHHNSSRQFGGRTASFYENEKRFRNKWKHRLPIATTCTIIK